MLTLPGNLQELEAYHEHNEAADHQSASARHAALLAHGSGLPDAIPRSGVSGASSGAPLVTRLAVPADQDRQPVFGHLS